MPTATLARSFRRARIRVFLGWSLMACFIGATAASAGTGSAADRAQLYSNALSRLTEWQRFAALRRAVLDSGERCKRVTAAAPQGRWSNLVMWVTRCDAGGDYGVFLGPDGSVQVRSCSDIVKVKLPACRKL